MTRRSDQISRLAHLARLKSDLEMRRFSAYRAHVSAARTRIADAQQQLQALYDSEAAHSISGARLANALAGDGSRALATAERELSQMIPGFEAARAVAVREFGRVRALEQILEDEVRGARRVVKRRTDDQGM